MLVWKLMKHSIKSQMQHRASFFMLAISHFFSCLLDMFGIWILFDRFKMLKDWSLSEIALIYGVIHMGFALAEGFGRGFDSFDFLVKRGDFDRLLLRPVSTLVQVATSQVQLMRIGRFLQGLMVLTWGAYSLDLPPHSFLLLAACTGGAAAVFYGLFILQATLAFWTTETLEVFNIMTYGGVEVGQYPISIFKQPLKGFFTFIIPLAAVGSYPIASLLHKIDGLGHFGWLMPLFGVLFLYVCCKLWNFGVKKYRSAGG